MIYAPPWLEVARIDAQLGVLEIPGVEHHPAILMYHSYTTLKATTDEVPWCSSFVNYCIAVTGLDLKPTRSAAARSWLLWGIRIDIPAFGCVAILKRGGADQPGPEVRDAQGHVGFFIDMPTRNEVLILGGNQSNQVCERIYPADRVLGYRWAA